MKRTIGLMALMLTRWLRSHSPRRPASGTITTGGR